MDRIQDAILGESLPEPPNRFGLSSGRREAMRALSAFGMAALAVLGIGTPPVAEMAAANRVESARKKRKRKSKGAKTGPAGPAGPAGPMGPPGPPGSTSGFTISIRNGDAVDQNGPGNAFAFARCDEGERAIAGGVLPQIGGCTLAGSWPDPDDDRVWRTSFVCTGTGLKRVIPKVTCLKIT